MSKRLVYAYRRSLDVTTTKKVVNFFGEEKCTLRENHPVSLAPRMRIGPPPYVAMPPPPNG